MLAEATTTFRIRLFRVLIVIGMGTACVVSIVVSALYISAMREMRSDDAHQGVLLATRLAAQESGRDGWKRFGELSAFFSRLRGLEAICVYNKENRVIQRWQADEHNAPCPAFLSAVGVHETFYAMDIAEPVQSDAGYLGTVYAASLLVPREATLRMVACIFLSFASVALLACALASHYGARHINHLMRAIRQQIDCLKGSTTECILLPDVATSETMDLFHAIRDLRIHLVTLLVPKETVLHLRQWYENVFFNLIALVRQRITEDSSLITLLSDCELLLRLNNLDEPLPQAEVTDISRLVEEGLSSARALNPPGSHVHLVASLKPGGAKEWKVQAGYLRALIRHVLLIGLARTSQGLVCLRLEIAADPRKANMPFLVWRLEDSGPPMQPGVMHSRLIDTQYKIISVMEASWLLAAQLTKRLKGSIHAENAPAGLLLQGEIPLAHPGPAHPQGAMENTVSPPMAGQPRLALVLADASKKSQSLCRLFERMQCRVIWAIDSIEALELAPTMPFSVIAVHASFLGRESHSAVRRLLALMENTLMPAVPLWVVTASEATSEHREWDRTGVQQILLEPVKQEKFISLCHDLLPFDEKFWAVCDTHLVQEFSYKMVTRLPQMRRDLLARIKRVYAAIDVLSPKPFGTEIFQEVHAVKSASLALGYMRLAALMANLEHMLSSPQTMIVSGNIAAIADCLKDIVLE